MFFPRGRRKTERQRDDLTGEFRAGDAGQIVLACLFAATWIGDTFFLRWTVFLNGCVPLALRVPFGVVLLVLAAYLARTSLSIVFGEQRQTPAVIRRSVFGIIRHPVYLSEILLYLGFLMLSMSLAAALAWLVAIAFLHGISRYEERLLLERFGVEYRRYMQDVPMWIPRFRNR